MPARFSVPHGRTRQSPQTFPAAPIRAHSKRHGPVSTTLRALRAVTAIQPPALLMALPCGFSGSSAAGAHPAVQVPDRKITQGVDPARIGIERRDIVKLLAAGRQKPIFAAHRDLL